jgi:hypothetical protein
VHTLLYSVSKGCLKPKQVVLNSVAAQTKIIQDVGFGKMRNTAVREIRACIARIAKGQVPPHSRLVLAVKVLVALTMLPFATQVAMHIEIWRNRQRYAMLSDADTMRSRLHTGMKVGRHVGGLRQVLWVLASMMKGVMGAALQGMRMNRADAKRREAFGELTMQMDRTAAARQMVTIAVAFTSMVRKNVVTCCFEVWHINQKRELKHDAEMMREDIVQKVRQGRCHDSPSLNASP